MNNYQEIDLIKSAVVLNIWVHRYPHIKEHLICVLQAIRENYFTDDNGNTRPDYPAFFADILTAHNKLYVDSLPCQNLRRNTSLVNYQDAVNHFRRIYSYLKAGGDIEFNLQGWEQGAFQGINVLSIRVWNKKHDKSELWDTRELSDLPDKLGFDKLGNIVTEAKMGSPRYDAINEALQVKLSEGWVSKGNSTFMAPVRSFSVKCKPLDATIKKYLPDITNKERASIILKLFNLDYSPNLMSIDVKKFADLLKQ